MRMEFPHDEILANRDEIQKRQQDFLNFQPDMNNVLKNIDSRELLSHSSIELFLLILKAEREDLNIHHVQ